MVLTQLQLKWPNHSSHLLTRLTYLFKNEQLVDCTLLCNKHILKVHRSVLAACSPYFERELQNNPSIVVKDMQFSVLKALIEFMYYGETRITEENFTSLIEAAKIFEVKGLSEMDIVSGKNGMVSSVVALDNDCIVESSCLSDDVDKATFEATTILQSLTHTTAASSTSMLDSSTTTSTCTNNNTSVSQSMNHCNIPCDGGIPLYEDAVGTDLMVESTSNSALPYDDQQQGPHSSRNFVVTPPQTESAQILLSLARSHNQKLFSSHIDDNGSLTDDKNDKIANSGIDFLNHGHHSEQQINASSSNINTLEFEQQSQPQQQQQQHSINNSNILFTDHNLILNDSCNGSSLISMDTSAATSGSGHQHRQDDVENETGANCGGKSLLAKLLTRNNHEIEQQASENFVKSTIYDVAKNDKNIAANTATTMNAVELQPSIILECPFLIETADGAYVDVCVENMLNSFDGATASVPVTSSATATASTIGTEEISFNEIPTSASAAINIATDPAVLDRIKHDTAPELEDDPDAVVLTKICEDGRVEKYVLSSADIQALKQMNERLAAASNAGIRSSSSSDMRAEIELPNNNDTPLITKILVDGTGGIQSAINRLPFKKMIVGSNGNTANTIGASCSGQPTPENCSSSSDGNIHHAMLDDSLAVDDTHHHENMFEELDNQFNTMDCCAIDDEEHIRRDYVAYEEASKNETQLEHNYYANAMKDEDEEGVVINDQYDLRMMMMIEETSPPPSQQQHHSQVDIADNDVKSSSSSSKKRYQNVQLLGTTTSSADICLNGNTLVAFAPKSTPTATLRINGGVGNVAVVSPAATGTATATVAAADKLITVVPSNGSGANKCDLIINDALMSSVLNIAPVADNSTLALVKNTSSVPATKRKVAAENNVLPFKSVKSANTFRNTTNSKKSSSSTSAKRTYNKRKTHNNPSNQNQQQQNIVAAMNGGFSNENNLIEEIIVDEIS